MTISTFTILKNEVEFIGHHVMSLLNFVDELVFSDGNSTDGTIEIIQYIQKKYDHDKKIKLFLDKDCKDLQDDYVRLFNWTLAQCKSEYIWFIHPDMLCLNPQVIKPSLESNAMRYSYKVRSFAEGNKIITRGRGDRWYTIFKNAFDLHYWGYYGTAHEDLYFRDITGNQHVAHQLVEHLPYEIEDTPIEICHYCDTKPYERRYDRMLKVLKISYPGLEEKQYVELASSHPRVSLKDGQWNGVDFAFEDTDFKPEVFKRYKFNGKKEGLCKKMLSRILS